MHWPQWPRLYFSHLNEGRSSWYDLNFDGLTNDKDLRIITANLGLRCPGGE